LTAKGIHLTEDEANVFTDTGWFQMDATDVPSSDDLTIIKKMLAIPTL